MVSGDFFELSADSIRTGGSAVLTIGVFDGVHRGHCRLLTQTVRRARELGCLAVAVIFSPRPSEVLRPTLPPDYLTTLEERLDLLADVGFDGVAVLRFNREVAAISAEAFAADLRERYRAVELWVGPDFALGRGRSGTVASLREIGRRLGFGVNTVEPLLLEGVRVSSTAIRKMLAEGDVVGAAEFLGRSPSVSGEVVAGAGRGRTIGLPTANVAAPPKLAVPANGVYAVRCEVLSEIAKVGAGAPSHSRLAQAAALAQCEPAIAQETAESAARTRLAGVANIGSRPTFDNGERSLEVHLLDFVGDLYGARLRVEFVARLRPEQRFSSVADLLGQIERDVAEARVLLG